MILVNKSPLIVSDDYWKDGEKVNSVTSVLHPIFDRPIIDFMDKNNIQVGEDLTEANNKIIKNKEKMEELKELRLEIDGLFQLTDNIVKASKANDNIHLEKVKECCDKLLYAKAWTGKLMGFLGGTSPYQNEGKRKEIEDIEPTDAVAEGKQWTGISHIEKIDHLRQQIEETNNKIINFVVPQGSSREANISRTQVFVYLTEARLALGFELERIRGGRQCF